MNHGRSNPPDKTQEHENGICLQTDIPPNPLGFGGLFPYHRRRAAFRLVACRGSVLLRGTACFRPCVAAVCRLRVRTDNHSFNHLKFIGSPLLSFVSRSGERKIAKKPISRTERFIKIKKNNYKQST
jgi:hypothetical protein